MGIYEAVVFSTSRIALYFYWEPDICIALMTRKVSHVPSVNLATLSPEGES